MFNSSNGWLNYLQDNSLVRSNIYVNEAVYSVCVQWNQYNINAYESDISVDTQWKALITTYFHFISMIFFLTRLWGMSHFLLPNDVVSWIVRQQQWCADDEGIFVDAQLKEEKTSCINQAPSFGWGRSCSQCEQFQRYSSNTTSINAHSNA